MLATAMKQVQISHKDLFDDNPIECMHVVVQGDGRGDRVVVSGEGRAALNIGGGGSDCCEKLGVLDKFGNSWGMV